MARLIVVLMSWIKLAATDMAAFALTVVTKMTDNANFPTPDVSLKDLSDQANLVVSTYGDRKNGSIAKTAFDDALAALDNMLHLQAYYVNDIANQPGNSPTTVNDIIVSAGYTSTKTGHTAATRPIATDAPILTTEEGGILHLFLKHGIPGAGSYCWVIFLDAVVNIAILNNTLIIPTGGNIIIIPEGTTREQVTGLTPGTTVHVMVLAQNAAGKSPWSPMMSKLIQ